MRTPDAVSRVDSSSVGVASSTRPPSLTEFTRAAFFTLCGMLCFAFERVTALPQFRRDAQLSARGELVDGLPCDVRDYRTPNDSKRSALQCRTLRRSEQIDCSASIQPARGHGRDEDGRVLAPQRGELRAEFSHGRIHA